MLFVLINIEYYRETIKIDHIIKKKFVKTIPHIAVFELINAITTIIIEIFQYSKTTILKKKNLDS